MKNSVTSSTLKVALLGCSAGPGEKHIAAWKCVPDAEISLLAERNTDLAKRMAGKYGIGETVDDCRKTIGRKDIDIIDIALPPNLHAELAIDALQAGHHVLCEKPMTTTVEEADRVVAAAGSSQSVFGVNFQFRFATFQIKIAELIRQGVIGRPVHWRATMANGSKDRAPNTGYEGILQDCGIHTFDIGASFLGRPCHVLAFGMKLSHRPNLGEFDTASAVITYEHGDEIALHLSNGTPRGIKGVESVEILGPEGIIQYDPIAGLVWNDHSQFTWTDNRMQTHTVPVEDWNGDWNVTRVALCQHFVDCVRDPSKDRSPLCSAEEGRLAAVMNCAITQSLQTGQRVKIEH